ncbi:MAG: hypothetical protein EAZ35_03170 [Sphingobacteriia bacterium]|jgi:ADP-heptose:LPS heptosyltransferase|nr:MAG: hypothetical protein EAZ35_03170 [Sphingobacteriia bacterium]
MKTLFLLRSYGDFIIALSQAVASNKPARLIASIHLEELYSAVLPFLPPTLFSIDFVDIGIDKGLLRSYTNRYFISKQSLKELQNLTLAIQNLAKDATETNSFFLEQKRKSFFTRSITGTNFLWVHEHGNIYDSYRNFFAAFNDLPSVVSDSLNLKGKRVLVFPDSRLKKKQITATALKNILLNLQQQNALAAVAKFQKPFLDDGIGYDDFKSLVALIAGADFIISSDSLPAHIAQLLQKPHQIAYAKIINHEFITPFARLNNTAFTF